MGERGLRLPTKLSNRKLPTLRRAPALAYKWQRILFRCWQTAEPYDEARYIAGLRKRNSPLVPYIDALEPIAA